MSIPTTTVFGITYDEAAHQWILSGIGRHRRGDIFMDEARCCFAHGMWPDHDITSDSELEQHWDGWYESVYGE